MADRLKLGRDKEYECAKAMVSNALLRAYWVPPRAQYRTAVDGGQDIFGVFDFVGFDDKGAIVGVQVCRKRPSDIAHRKTKIEILCNLYHPALRPMIAYYNKTGFIVEELLPDLAWRLKALLPYDKYTAIREDLEPSQTP